jgi:probable F420-dependent oxidoreductase
MIAATTSRIRLGTNVYNIGLRHPFVVARAVATLDALSGGRVEFGIGSSWLEQEWIAIGLDFSRRGKRVDEAIEVCQRLWSDEVVEYHGEFFDFSPVAFNPKPIQRPYPKLIIGGDGSAARRRAATVGDGWFPLNSPLEELPAALSAINQRRSEVGRAGTTTLTVSSGADVRPDLDRYSDLGVGRLIMRPYTSSKTAIDEIRRYGDEVLHDLNDEI